MTKELEALGKIKETIIPSTRSNWETEYYYVGDIGSTRKHFHIIEQALKRLSMFEELFVKMDLELEIEIGDDSWGTSQDYGTYVRGENSTFEELYIADDDTVMLISKLKDNEIETMYNNMTSEMAKMSWSDEK